MLMAELTTAVSHNLPVKIVVWKTNSVSEVRFEPRSCRSSKQTSIPMSHARSPKRLNDDCFRTWGYWVDFLGLPGGGFQESYSTEWFVVATKSASFIVAGLSAVLLMHEPVLLENLFETFDVSPHLGTPAIILGAGVFPLYSAHIWLSYSGAKKCGPRGK